ncbi:hypothetical protein EOI86_01325 [Hwanghaeella grinnelliae]|uniref:Peptidase S8/S53 domain-containing protein n=1 Tax=Hwanghaeella grinnelliae TaxID=2500179 RepID=A0A3S2W5X6_9PROT|nr:S8 family serine peptidase [Hwanghaeella grinnelliae]RVU37976.1 hypothetical protein EOI86_01325 [Hwanghaeella grinnelliae]
MKRFATLLPFAAFVIFAHTGQGLAFDRARLAELKALTLKACEENPTHAGSFDDGRWTVRTIEDYIGVDVRFRRSFRLTDADGTTVILGLDGYGGSVRRAHSDMRLNGIPFGTIDLGPRCAVKQARILERNGEDLFLVTLGPDLQQEGAPETLNPPVPPGEDPEGVTVVHVDTGVNYLLPEVAAHLARGDSGRILGYDFWDMDPRPFDVETSRSPYYPIRHGTSVASILLREAPMTRMIPYRYPRPDMRRMGEIVAYAAQNGARIVMMPLGSNREIDWRVFALAAEEHPDILFIVSAGNDDRNIDDEPVFPAALPLENMVVATSADAFGRLAKGSNWGAQSVDLMVPAESIETVDHRGATVVASGSSYAVPRVTAMAVRILAQNPEQSVADLVAALKGHTGRSMERGAAKVKWGWVPNPLDAP